MRKSTDDIINFIRQKFNAPSGFIPLHAPHFGGKEKEYLCDTIDSTFVSSVGNFVNRFEEEFARYTGAKYAIACVNGTNALHIAMLVNGVKEDEEVLTQALTFIATANAISYIHAKPVFVDVDRDTLGMSPESLSQFLEENAHIKDDGFAYNKVSGRRIAACIPMHTFGLPSRIEDIKDICDQWNIVLIEDAAESLGSYYNGRHTGTIGNMGTFSFNGNKTITCGGGGALITDDEALAKRAKHLTTQAKVPHPWRFMHDDIGYNYRMPNLNAALACAQLEQLDTFLENKRALAMDYAAFFKGSNIHFVEEIENAQANYWLNAIIFETEQEKELFLEQTNQAQVMTRPVWDLMIHLPMFLNAQRDNLENSLWLEQRVVNIPSSYRP